MNITQRNDNHFDDSLDKPTLQRQSLPANHETNQKARQIWQQLVDSYINNPGEETKELYCRLKKEFPDFELSTTSVGRRLKGEEFSLALCYEFDEDGSNFEKRLVNKIAEKALLVSVENYSQLPKQLRKQIIQEHQEKYPDFNPNFLLTNRDRACLYFDYQDPENGASKLLECYLQNNFHKDIPSEALVFETIVEGLKKGIFDDPIKQRLLLFKVKTIPLTSEEEMELTKWACERLKYSPPAEIAANLHLIAFLSKLFTSNFLRQIVLDKLSQAINTQERNEWAHDLIDRMEWFGDFVSPFLLDLVLDDNLTIKSFSSESRKTIQEQIKLKLLSNSFDIQKLLIAKAKYGGSLIAAAKYGSSLIISLEEGQRLKLIDDLSSQLHLINDILIRDFFDLFILELPKESPEKSSITEKEEKVATFFWNKLCEQYFTIGEGERFFCKNQFLKFFPNFCPNLENPNSSQAKLFFDFYRYSSLDLSYPHLTSSLISLIFSEALDLTEKKAVFYNLENHHEALLRAAFERGEAGIEALLALNTLFKISVEQETKWIEELNSTAIQKEKALAFIKLLPGLRVVKKERLFSSKLCLVIANKIYQTYPESLEELAAALGKNASILGNLFYQFNETKEFEELNFALYRCLRSQPQLNTFSLPPTDDEYFQETYAITQSLFADFSSYSQNIYPRLSFNKQLLTANLGGNCYGTVLEIARIMLNYYWEEPDFVDNLVEVYRDYQQGVTRDAFITQLAYRHLLTQTASWHDPIETVYETLSSEKSEVRIGAIFLICLKYTINPEKMVSFLERLSTSKEEIAILHQLISLRDLPSFSTISASFEKGNIEEEWLLQILPLIGIDKDKNILIKKVLRNFYALRQTVVHLNLQGQFPNKKFLKIFTDISTKNKGRSDHLEPLFQHLNIKITSKKLIGEAVDIEKLKSWSSTAKEGCYTLTLSLKALGDHAVIAIQKEGVFYLIDPNLPGIYPMPREEFASIFSNIVQQIYNTNLQESSDAIIALQQVKTRQKTQIDNLSDG